MLDSKDIKSLGLRFGRSLQSTLKSVMTFSPEHQSAQRPIQQSFDFLNGLLKETGQFTFGFLDNQVVLNTILTTDPSFAPLEKEFLKRGIAAVTFKPGLTVSRFKKLIGLLSTPIRVIENSGSLRVFLEENEIEGIHILPASKNQKKNAQGDTVLETDTESYILSKQLAGEEGPRDFKDSIDALLESAGYDPTARSAVLSNLASSGRGPLQGWSGDVPPDSAGAGMETQGSAAGLSSVGVRGNGIHVVAGSPGSPGAASSAPSPGAGGVGVDMQGNSGGESAEAFRASSGFPGGSANMTSDIGAVGDAGFMKMMQSSVEHSLVDEGGNPRKSCGALTRVWRGMGTERILAAFPVDRREELRTLPPEQLAAEYFEDTALSWAGKRLQAPESKAEGELGKYLVDDDVVRVLARSLQATQNADRLAAKLKQFIRQYSVSPEVQQKIREELDWTAQNTAKKFAHLMEVSRYTPVEFRRLVEFLKYLVSNRELDPAAELAIHYFEFMDEEALQIRPEEINRSAELMRTASVTRIAYVAPTVERLGRTLMREDVPVAVHASTATVLTILSQSIVQFEDFENVFAIGVALDRSQKRNPVQHQKCCGTALSRILPPNTIERIIEIYLVQRDDSAWGRMAAGLIRFGAPASIEKIFAHLIEEKDARARMAILRLIGLLRLEALDVARKHLQDGRWYVVRNMCNLLAQIEDPELAQHIGPALQHPDPRVQEAAFNAVAKGRGAGRAAVLANSLAMMAPNIFEKTLDELQFLKDPESLPGLMNLLAAGKSSPAIINRIIQIVTALPEAGALDGLGRMFRINTLDFASRRAALKLISRNSSPQAAELLADLAHMHDPLANEARKSLESRTK